MTQVLVKNKSKPRCKSTTSWTWEAVCYINTIAVSVSQFIYDRSNLHTTL